MKDNIRLILDIKEFELPNGLRVIMSKRSDLPIAAMNMTFHIGSKDEDDDKTGIAHLLEHLMFEGSPNTSRGEFDEILNKNGGDSNAYTSWDLTGYYLVLPSSKLELGFWLDSDRLAGFGITEDSFEIQRNVVLEEKLQVQDNVPYGSLEEESSKRLFKNSGYRWPVIGFTENIENLKFSDVRYFFDKYYKPDNAVLSIVGDIDYTETEKQIKKYYGGIERGEGYKRKPFTDNYLVTEQKDTIISDVQLPGKFLFYLLPKAGSKEYYEMNILNQILTSGESSKLYNELIYKSQYANEAESMIFAMEHISIFFVNLIARKGIELNELEKKYDKIISDVKKGNFTDEDLRKAKNKLETNYFTKFHSSIYVSEKLAEYHILFGEYGKLLNEIDFYEKIGRDEIIDVSNKYLNNNQRVNLSYVPKE
ncbi:MAG: pitrilysin family protein [Ignavibacteria bacterium]